MFRSPFSRTKFNTGGVGIIVLFSAHASGKAEMYSEKKMAAVTPFNLLGFNRTVFKNVSTFDYNVDVTSGTLMQGTGSMQSPFERLITSVVEEMSSKGEMLAPYIRERLFNALMQGKGTMEANGNRYTIEEFSFKNLNQGDTVIIDMDRLIVTKNNVNALNDFEGDFFNLYPGENNLTYTDGETQRTVNIQVRYRNRWY